MTPLATESAVQERRPRAGRLLLIRSLVVLTLLLGANYIGWRWLHSVNWSA